MNSWTWNVFEDMERMRRDIDRVLSGRERPVRFPFSRISFLPGRAARSYPLVNVGEDSDNFFVEALAPGIDPAKIDISLLGNQLTISGEKLPLPESVRDEDIHRNERASGRFTRLVRLPAAVESGKISADYANGLLKITLPKAAEARPKRIEVRTQ